MKSQKRVRDVRGSGIVEIDRLDERFGSRLYTNAETGRQSRGGDWKEVVMFKRHCDNASKLCRLVW